MKLTFRSMIGLAPLLGVLVGCSGAGPEAEGTSSAALSADQQCKSYGGTPKLDGCYGIHGFDITSEIYAPYLALGGVDSIGLPLGAASTCVTPPGVPVAEVPCQRFQRATIEHHAYDTKQPFKIGLVGRDWLNAGATLALAELTFPGTHQPGDSALVSALLGTAKSICFDSSKAFNVERTAGIDYVDAAAHPVSTDPAIVAFVNEHGGLARWGYPITPVLHNGPRGDEGAAELNTRRLLDAISDHAVGKDLTPGSIFQDVGNRRLDGAIVPRDGIFDVIARLQIFERGRLEVHLQYASKQDAETEGVPSVLPKVVVEAGLVGSEIEQLLSAGPDRCEQGP